MSAQVFHQSILILGKGIWVDELSPPLYFVVVIIKRFPFDVLVLPCEHLVPDVEVVRCLLVGYGLNKSLDLVVIVTVTDSAPPQYHLDNLLYRSVALVFKLAVDRQSDLGLGHF